MRWCACSLTRTTASRPSPCVALRCAACFVALGGEGRTVCCIAVGGGRCLALRCIWRQGTARPLGGRQSMQQGGKHISLSVAACLPLLVDACLTLPTLLAVPLFALVCAGGGTQQSRHPGSARREAHAVAQPQRARHGGGTGRKKAALHRRRLPGGVEAARQCNSFGALLRQACRRRCLPAPALTCPKTQGRLPRTASTRHVRLPCAASPSACCRRIAFHRACRPATVTLSLQSWLLTCFPHCALRLNACAGASAAVD